MDAGVVAQNIATEIFNPAYQLIAGIAFVYFLYGAAKYIYDLNNPQAEAIGKQHLLWGMIGLFIIFSVGGILSLFSGVFGGLFGS